MNYNLPPSQDLVSQLKCINYLAQLPVQDTGILKERIKTLAEVHQILASLKKETLAYSSS